MGGGVGEGGRGVGGGMVGMEGERGVVVEVGVGLKWLVGGVLEG